MNIFKRIATFLICLIIVFMPIFNGLTFYVSANDSSVPAGYQQVSDNNQYGEAFLAYCKSRDSNITSSVLGNSSTAAYTILADACRGLGFNISDLQSHLWYLQDGNNPTKWFFDSTGINLYNQAFAYLIHENGLEVGDKADVDLYNGYLVTDDDGNTCYAFVMYNNPTNNQYGLNYSSTDTFDNVVKFKGTPLKYDSNALIGAYNSGVTPSITINGNTTNYTIYKSSGQGTIFYGFSSTGSNYSFIYDQFASEQNTTSGVTDINIEGYTSVFVVDGSNAIYLCSYTRSSYIRKSNSNTYHFYRIVKKNSTNQQNSSQNVIINFTTNNNVINNNVNEGDTIINNEGDVINEGDNNTIIYNPYPDNPNYDPNNPSSGTTTGPSNGNVGGGSDGIINFPNIDFNLPEINWSLGDLSNKFPFSIPFDLVQLVTVLDAPAEAPRFEGTVNFGFTTWDYDINLESFDTVASVCRTTELVLFIFGLILITRNLIKG